MAVAPDVQANGGGPDSGGVKKKNKKTKQVVDRPDPAWLFPPDEKKSSNGSKDTAERAEAIEYLKHQALQAPRKPAPPTQLMHMIRGFLVSYGFQSTSRLFATEWKARANVIGWETPKDLDEPSQKSSDLVRAYKDWQTSSKKDGESKDQETSSEDSSSSESDASKEDKETSSSGSESDTGSSDEEVAPPVKIVPPSAITKPGASSTNTLKRKARSASTVSSKSSETSSDSSSSGSDSGSGSDSDSDRPVKKPKIEATSIEVKIPTKTASAPESTNQAAKVQKSDSESSSDSSSDSESSEDDEPLPNAPAIITTDIKAKKASTKLVNGKAGRTSSSSSASDALPYFDATDSPKGDAGAVVAAVVIKTNESSPLNQSSKKGGKVSKKIITPFRRIPEDTKIDPRLSSNAYQSYDYADRAYRDLSVTKGKGFTKEKNKKKRGSYRGGPIDIWGAKGIKFED